MLKDKLQSFNQSEQGSIFSHLKRGIEKENLRVDKFGKISFQPHPRSLGSALTNPWITTDFAESLVEVITPPAKTVQAVYDDLFSVTQFVMQNIGSEFLWPSSMPGELNAESIPLADYGKTNIARMKKIYRQGLCYRYGRAMQVIAGIHYNFSLPAKFFQHLKKVERISSQEADYINQKYLALVRNFFRYGWVLVYLFGASPVCAQSSVTQAVDYLQDLPSTKYGEFATSLRLSELGYHNKGEDLLNISYDSVNHYADSLLQATKTPYKAFSAIGIRDGDSYRQLNDAVLQIENEYYSPIRPKQIAQDGERPANALLKRGIEYIEVRILDLNPLEPLGITKSQMAFIDIFLTFCLLEDSSLFAEKEYFLCKENIRRVAVEGRNPDLQLLFVREEVSFCDEVKKLFDKLIPVAELMDQDDSFYLTALKNQYEKIIDVEKTPSAQVLAKIENEKLTFQELNMQLAQMHKETILNSGIMPMQRRLASIAEKSLEQFTELELQPQKPFDEFLDTYFSA